nr:MAG TPA: hypothetical protein [Caudoviricetes sp.]
MYLCTSQKHGANLRKVRLCAKFYMVKVRQLNGN